MVMVRRGFFRTHGAIGLLLLVACLQPATADDAGMEWVFIPFPIYSPETHWALTLSAIGTARFGDVQPSTALLIAAWSEKGQRSLSFRPELYLDGGWWLKGGLAIEDWPSEFYGLGRDKPSPVPPGERLLDEFLKPMGLSQYRLAKEIGAAARPAPYTDP